MGIVRIILLTASFLASFYGCSKKGEGSLDEQGVKVHKPLSESTLAAYRGVPADAVLIFDFESLSEVSDIVADTLSFAYGLLDPASALLKFNTLLLSGNKDIGGTASSIKEAHTLFTLHYSSVNETSLLQIIDIEAQTIDINDIIGSKPISAKAINGAKIYSYSNGLKVAQSGNLLLASSSHICVESALRHLANNTSILDIGDFQATLRESGSSSCLYINHKQIGKLFSGSVTYGFLKYADFAMRIGTWSALDIGLSRRGGLELEGFIGSTDAAHFSTVLLKQEGALCQADKVLPASTMFAISLNISDLKGYLTAYGHYLDANKKKGSKDALMERVALPEISPVQWVENEGYDEIVSAFCLVGGRYEWVILAHKNSATLFHRLTGIKPRSKNREPSDFIYKGYFEALFGELFSHCSQEQWCKVGEWTIIGSKRAVAEFFSGAANKINLRRYLADTPASSFFSTKGVAKAIVNAKEGADTLFIALNSYYRARFTNSLKHKNFEYLTLNITPVKGRANAKLNFYASTLSDAPQMFEPNSSESSGFIDSTFRTDYGPFPLVDPQTGDSSYFEQSKKFLSISYRDKKQKGLWGIPMKDTIKSMADMVVLPDGRSYITFILGNKLYMMNRKGAHATGYPITLKYEIALGPKVLQSGGEYSLMMITKENFLIKTDLKGAPAPDWNNIKAPEFIRSMPEPMVLYGTEYLILRTVGRTRIYTSQGVEITAKNTNRPISTQSTIEEAREGYIKVMGADGKEFLFNLSSGRIKKL